MSMKSHKEELLILIKHYLIVNGTFSKNSSYLEDHIEKLFLYYTEVELKEYLGFLISEFNEVYFLNKFSLN